MELTPTNPEGRRAAAFTVAELLVAVTVGLTLLLAAIQFYCFSLRSFVSMANYTTLNNQSRTPTDAPGRSLTRKRGGMTHTLRKPLVSFIFSLYQRRPSNPRYNRSPAA